MPDTGFTPYNKDYSSDYLTGGNEGGPAEKK